MEVRQYRATSVSQIVPLNRYTIWMQTTFKEVRRDIIGCCSLLTQVYLWLFTHSSLASPNDARHGGCHYWHAKIYTFQYSFTPSCLDALLHLNFPSSSDEKRVKIKTWLDYEVLLAKLAGLLREDAERFASLCAMILELRYKSVPPISQINVRSVRHGGIRNF